MKTQTALKVTLTIEDCKVARDLTRRAIAEEQGAINAFNAFVGGAVLQNIKGRAKRSSRVRSFLAAS